MDQPEITYVVFLIKTGFPIGVMHYNAVEQNEDYVTTRYIYPHRSAYIPV